MHLDGTMILAFSLQWHFYMMVHMYTFMTVSPASTQDCCYCYCCQLLNESELFSKQYV